MTARKVLSITLLIIAVLVVTAGVVIAMGPNIPLGGLLKQGVPVGTGFAYQGRLDQDGSPADGSFDFVFSLHDSEDDGSQVGEDVSLDEVQVVDGLFTVHLGFGDSVFNGEARWLEISVKPVGGQEFTTLMPRQPLAPTPYAIYALTSPWSGLTGIPDSVADGRDDDALGPLNCNHNEIAKWNDIAQAWQCSEPLAEVDESQQFTESGTFVVPEGVARVQIEVWGAGGGGGNHGDGGLFGGGGGGGSGGYTRTVIDVAPGEQLVVDIGVGGDPESDDSPATNGEPSRVLRDEDLMVSATGGKPGSRGDDAICESPFTPGVGGAGGDGGIGDTQDGNPGIQGGTGSRFGFPVVSCHQGVAGSGGVAIEGTMAPVGSGGGFGGGVLFTTPNPPIKGQNGFILLRW